jgi:transcriptional regulator with XRE-family HTH domain
MCVSSILLTDDPAPDRRDRETADPMAKRPHDPHSVAASIADNVRRRRDAAGLSLADLAALAGTSKGTVTAVESGAANPTVETVHALAGALGCSIGDLLDGSPDPMTTLSRGNEAKQAIGHFQGRLLHRFTPTGPVELMEMVLTSARRHESAPHPDGVYEHLWIAEGRLLVGTLDASVELAPGDYFCFPGWHRHHYKALERPVRILMALSLRRSWPAAPTLHHSG